MSAPTSPTPWRTLHWQGDALGTLILLDQTRLPRAYVERTCGTVEEVWEAIRTLRVRGAPAIGLAAAYGLVLGLRDARTASEPEFYQRLDEVSNYLAGSRPTAVNLCWALERLGRVAQTRSGSGAAELHDALWREAVAIHEEDRRICRAIGDHGARLLPAGGAVLTHCNAGGLATSEYGTALAVLYRAHEQGRTLHVFVDETRPLLQGARLTAWELMHSGIPCTLICDSMAAVVMRERNVRAVVVGADRIAANGDTANKIGTYGLAVLARAHNIPFYVAAPRSTFDPRTPRGQQIVIEERAAEEISAFQGIPIAPEGVHVYNPAFDVTPAELISAFITESGIVPPADVEHWLAN